MPLGDFNCLLAANQDVYFSPDGLRFNSLKQATLNGYTDVRRPILNHFCSWPTSKSNLHFPTQQGSWGVAPSTS